MFSTLLVILAAIVFVSAIFAFVKVASIDSNPNHQIFENVDRHVTIYTQNGKIRK
jgi:hypothetical protein